MSWHSIAWGSAPEWVTAVVTGGAFVAAGAAARWAARAAKHAGEQAEYARKQSETAAAQLTLTERQVDLARNDATRQREQARRTHLLALQSRLDQRAPSIYAVARPGAGDEPLLSYIDRRSLPAEPHSGTAWAPVDAPREVRNDSNEAYRVALTIELVNFGDLPARVEFTNQQQFQLDRKQGEALYIPPHESRTITWHRVSTAQAEWEEVNAGGKAWLMDLELWVRDTACEVRDTHIFNADLRFFTTDGSRLLVRPTPEHAWTENYAQPYQPRVYERLPTTNEDVEAL